MKARKLLSLTPSALAVIGGVAVAPEVKADPSSEILATIAREKPEFIETTSDGFRRRIEAIEAKIPKKANKSPFVTTIVGPESGFGPKADFRGRFGQMRNKKN